MAKDDILSYGTIGGYKEKGNRHIVAISGGVASAWVANWARLNLKGEVIYYFNDTKWEHPDLYRFLADLEGCLDIDILRDNDGRNPEQVFYDQKMLGSNMAPLCSKILKAEMCQRFVKDGDTIYFGIDRTEYHRAARIGPIYARLGVKCVFPLIENEITREQTFRTVHDLGIEIPQMYKDGFKHNNCAGGCVRANTRQWISLLRLYPEVYAERERVEVEFTVWNNKRRKEKNPEAEWRQYHFLKDISLKDLREDYQKGIDLDFGDDGEWQGECVGICGRMY